VKFPGSMSTARDFDPAERDRLVRRVIVLEGIANVCLLLLKLVVGFATGSMAVRGDAVHSLTDVANNVLAWFVIGVSSQAPDREHPYGHRKFETVAVFALATLLTVLAVELALAALRRDAAPVAHEPWALATMLAVLVINVAVATWETVWARRLGSEILHADARHTFADVLTTGVVIAGWQIAARDHQWIDTACALGVACLILYLAYDLFRRATPVLVDRAALAPEAVAATVASVAGVCRVLSVRSRWTGAGAAVDLTVTVDPALSTRAAHDISDEIERVIAHRYSIEDATVHIEPDDLVQSPGEHQ
jgi:cation diffusion facilitator family transporter